MACVRSVYGTALCVQDNIMRALRWLVKDSKPTDSLVFVFSGRSAQASPGEELQTGSSEGLLPVNYAQVLPLPILCFPTCLCHLLEHTAGASICC